MSGFISYADKIERVLEKIIASPKEHAKWLNTLSFLENCGARKIAQSEHPTLVKEEVLKHAAEEFRHAHYLKCQLPKLSSEKMESYDSSFILGKEKTRYYLPLLDLQASRYLKEQGYDRSQLKEAAYLFVTYAIERRALELYPIYDKLLRASSSKVGVRSILLEEKEHLQEMEEGIKALPFGERDAAHISFLESGLCRAWLEAML